MDVRAALETAAPAERLFALVADLERYPDWLDIVPRATPAERHADDPGPAWSVELRGRLGPLARSKRLRMTRAVHDPPRRVEFRRSELDAREHAAWVLVADVASTATGSRLEMHLHYAGRFAGRPLEALLGQEIRRSRGRLLELLG